MNNEYEPPKQWRHWVKKFGLSFNADAHELRHRPYGGDRYLKGHGRYWRLDYAGNLDMSEPFEEFDRWANSLELSVPMTAKNQGEFALLVERMLPPMERIKFMVRQRTGHNALPYPVGSTIAMIRSIPAERTDAPAQVGTVCYDDSELSHPLSDEAERASRSNMRVLKARPDGEFELFASGVGKGRSLFFGDPTQPPVYLDVTTQGQSVREWVKL